MNNISRKISNNKNPYLVCMIVFFMMIVLPKGVLGQSGSNESSNIQNVALPSPTAASIKKFEDYPINYATGVPQISIPLYVASSRKLSIPISLSYHASGVRVEEVPGWVGSGWSLNAGGAIVRSVRGLPDEQTKGYLEEGDHAHDFESTPGSTQYKFDVVTGVVDAEPDDFSISAPGLSGKFTFKYDGTIVLLPHQNLEIEADLTSISGEIAKFTVTKEDGTVYTFAEREETYMASINKSGGDPGYIPARTYTSSWYLTKIESPYGDDEITLSYENSGLTTDYTVTMSTNRTNNLSHSTCTISEVDTDIQNTNKTYNRFLKTITTPTEKIHFDRDDTFGLSTKSRLESILVETADSAVRIKKYVLDTDTVGNRLTLAGVKEFGATDSDALPAYELEYYDTYTLPAFNSYAIDHWGYYNGETSNNTYIPEVYVTETSSTLSGADRDPVFAYAVTGSLKKVTLPTGGNTSFVYELNDYYKNSTAKKEPGGGIRIKSITTHDGISIANDVVRTYTYLDQNDTSKSSGYLTGGPIELYEYTAVDGNNPCPFVVRNSKPKGLIGGAPVAYTDVQEYLGTVSTNQGYSKYDLQYSLHSGRDDKTWKRGRVKEVEHFKSDDTIVQRQVNAYNFSANEVDTSYAVEINIVWNNSTLDTAYATKKIPFNSQTQYMSKQTSYMFDALGSNSMSTEDEYIYGYDSSDKILKLSELKQTNSDGTIKKQKFGYAYEEYAGMKSANMISQVYSVLLEDATGDTLSKNWTTWSNSITGNTNWNIKEQWQWEGSGISDVTAPADPSSEAVKIAEVMEYDSYGNPLEIEDNAGIKTKYFFGTNDSTLINSAVGVNAAPGVYLTGIQQIQGSENAPVNGQRPSSGDDLFVEAQYDEKGRLIEKIAANGERSSFEYDDLNRLSLQVMPTGSKNIIDYRYSSDFNSGSFSSSDPNSISSIEAGSDSPRDFIADHKELTYFDGENDFINFGDIAALDTPDEFSISLWFNRKTDNSGTSNDTNHDVNNVLVAQSSSASNDNIEIGTEGTNIEVYLDTDFIDAKESYNAGIQNDTWYHLALTYDGNSAVPTKLFVNGNMVKSWDDNYWLGSLDNSNSSPLSLGLARPSSDQWGDFNGHIADFRTFDRTLSTSEVSSLYEGTESVSYLDGLGRPIQSQTKAPDGTAIITGTLYDERGRPYITSRPIQLDVDTYTNGFVNNLWGTGFAGGEGEALPTSSEIYQYYDTGFSGTTDAKYAYTQTKFEDSPLSRQTGMGNAASLLRLGENESVMDYGLNSSSEGFSGFTDNELSKTVSTDPNGNHSFSFTDGWGNTIASMVDMDGDSTKDSDDLITEFQYDLRNQLKKVTAPEGDSTTYNYNQRGQLIEKEMPDKDDSDEYRYDDRGNLRFTESAKHKNNGSQSTLYNAHLYSDQTLSIPGDGVLDFDISFSESSIDDEIDFDLEYEDGSDIFSYYFTAWETDASGVHPVGKGSYKLNQEPVYYQSQYGFLTEVIYKPFTFTYNNYDELNRITETGEYYGVTSFENMNANNDVTGSKVAMQKYFYGEANAKAGANNTKGKLAKVEYRDMHSYNSWGKTWYSYNSQGLVEWIIQDLPGSSMGEKKIEYTYDELGRVTEMDYQAGESDDYYFRYSYDNLGRLAKTESRNSSGGSWVENAEYTYFADGQLSDLQLGNGVENIDYTYGSEGWLTSINDPGTLGSDRFGQNMTYDFAGNIDTLSWNQSQNSGQKTYYFSYDRANRLDTADQSSGNAWDVINEYNKNGVITNIKRWDNNGSLTNEYEIDPVTNSNRIDTIIDWFILEQVDVEYDANGNMIENGLYPTKLQSARYDARNLPYTIDGTSTIYHIYDADEQRVSKKIGSTTTSYIRGADGQTIATYVNGTVDKWNLISGGDIVGTAENGSAFIEYFIKDHLGSTRAIENNINSPVAYYDFYPLGKLMPGRHTTSNDDRYKFTGHELDSDAGIDLSYAGARYLDSEIGSWLSIDPMVDKYPGLSPYNYTMNNPLNLVDPDGRMACCEAFVKKVNDFVDSSRKKLNKFFNNVAFNPRTSKNVLGSAEKAKNETKIGASYQVGLGLKNKDLIEVNAGSIEKSVEYSPVEGISENFVISGIEAEVGNELVGLGTSIGSIDSNLDINNPNASINFMGKNVLSTESFTALEDNTRVNLTIPLGVQSISIYTDGNTVTNYTEFFRKTVGEFVLSQFENFPINLGIEN